MRCFSRSTLARIEKDSLLLLNFRSPIGLGAAVLTVLLSTRSASYKVATTSSEKIQQKVLTPTKKILPNHTQ
jgi:hypothetical protein